MTLDRAAKVIESGIERGLHIGAQLYVSQGGKRVADFAFGLAREGVAMTPDTIMLWMSSTKPITALAIAQMWERGKISLDDRVAKYIPEFGVRGKEPITIRHVLTHTGGFRAAVGPWTYDSWEQIITQISDSQLEPGWIVGKTVFLPFVNLHQEHYWWPDDSASGEYSLLGRNVTIRGSILRYYLWLQIIAGWLLSAIFVAGVTGLMRAD